MKSITWITRPILAVCVPCHAMKLIDTPCQNYEKTKETLAAAKAVWAAPPCYDFSYTFMGFQVGTPSPKRVQVRNGVSSGDKDMDDFFDMIESRCVRDCPTSGAARCSVTFSDLLGFPTRIEIDISQFTPDGARNYVISDFAVVECSAQPQIQDDKDRFVNHQLCSTEPF